MPIKRTAYIGLFIFDDCSFEDSGIAVSETSLPGKRRAQKRRVSCPVWYKNKT